MNGFSYLDLGILILLIYFMINGFSSGFIKQTSLILGVLVAVIIAINYYQDFQQYIEPFFELSPQVMQLISFAILLIIVTLFIHILGLIIRNILKMLFLGPLDSIAGALLGLVKGLIIAYFFVLLLDQLPIQEVAELLERSLASNLLSLTPILTENMQNIYEP